MRSYSKGENEIGLMVRSSNSYKKAYVKILKLFKSWETVTPLHNFLCKTENCEIGMEEYLAFLNLKKH